MLRGSTYRSYFFFANFGDETIYEFSLDYANNGSSGMDIVVERPPGRFGSDFIGIAPEEVKVDSVGTGEQVKTFKLDAQTLYRVQVQTLSPRTINLGDFRSYGRYNFELTVSKP